MSEIVSEIAYFRKQQALREEAVQLGLNGYAEVARHERIIARMVQPWDMVENSASPLYPLFGTLFH